jgi:hypothetical protein
MSLWEKTKCRECSHPRWLHMEGRKAVLCDCEGFVEHPPDSEPEFTQREWALINEIHSKFPNIPFTHNELAEILALWEARKS